MKLFEFEFTLEEMGQIVNGISDRLNRRKNGICMLLYVANEFMIDWYNQIETSFNIVIIRGGIRNLGEQEHSNLYDLINRTKYTPIYDT